MLKYANGALIVIAGAALAVLVARRSPGARARLPVPILTSTALVLLAGLALAFLAFPNFTDHAAPAMADLGMQLAKGNPLYPGLDAYSFHGLLYGPLLFEIQSAAIFLGSTLAGLPVILSSKLPGVLAFLAAGALFFRLARGREFGLAYYALFLLPFGILAFWNRCEPLFLLLVTLGFWAVESLQRRQALLVLGLCAGLAAGFKLHGFLYIAPAAIAFFSREGPTVRDILILATAAAGAFLLLFLPAGASLPGFADYLLLAAGHGLATELLLANLAFVAALWSPLLAMTAAQGSWRTLPRATLLALAALQVAAAIVGAKPGAGIHHLLPFIPANALMFSRCIGDGAKSWTQWIWVAALLPGLAASADRAWVMARDWRGYAQASLELERIQARYPDAVMGLAGSQTYARTFLRSKLALRGATQVEYSSYMDLRFMGVPDTPLRKALEDCRIGHLAMPRGEPPFSLSTYYAPPAPLFSDALRETFARRFVKVAEGRWYDVYECRPAAA